MDNVGESFAAMLSATAAVLYAAAAVLPGAGRRAAAVCRLCRQPQTTSTCRRTRPPPPSPPARRTRSRLPVFLSSAAPRLNAVYPPPSPACRSCRLARLLSHTAHHSSRPGRRSSPPPPVIAASCCPGVADCPAPATLLLPLLPYRPPVVAQTAARMAPANSRYDGHRTGLPGQRLSCPGHAAPPAPPARRRRATVNCWRF